MTCFLRRWQMKVQSNGCASKYWTLWGAAVKGLCGPCEPIGGFSHVFTFGLFGLKRSLLNLHGYLSLWEKRGKRCQPVAVQV